MTAPATVSEFAAAQPQTPTTTELASPRVLTETATPPPLSSLGTGKVREYLNNNFFLNIILIFATNFNN